MVIVVIFDNIKSEICKILLFKDENLNQNTLRKKKLSAPGY